MSILRGALVISFSLMISTSTCISISLICMVFSTLKAWICSYIPEIVIIYCMTPFAVRLLVVRLFVGHHQVLNLVDVLLCLFHSCKGSLQLLILERRNTVQGNCLRIVSQNRVFSRVNFKFNCVFFEYPYFFLLNICICF